MGNGQTVHFNQLSGVPALTSRRGSAGFRQYAGQSWEHVNTGQRQDGHPQGLPLRNANNHLGHAEIHTNSPRIYPVGAPLVGALTCGRGCARFRQYVSQSCEHVNTGHPQGVPLRKRHQSYGTNRNPCQFTVQASRDGPRGRPGLARQQEAAVP